MIHWVGYHGFCFIGRGPGADVFNELKSISEAVGSMGEGFVRDAHGIADGFPQRAPVVVRRLFPSSRG